MKTRDYREDLLKRLKSRNYATKLLRVAFAESCKDCNWEAFGLVLQDIIEAQGNNKQAFAKRAKVSRRHLYRLFEKNANPTINTLLPVLSSLGFSLELREESSRQKQAA